MFANGLINDCMDFLPRPSFLFISWGFGRLNPAITWTQTIESIYIIRWILCLSDERKNVVTQTLHLNELHSSQNIRIEPQKYLFANSLRRARRVESHLDWVQQPILYTLLVNEWSSVWNTEHNIFKYCNHKFLLFFHRNTHTHTRTRYQKDPMGCKVPETNQTCSLCKHIRCVYSRINRHY